MSDANPRATDGVRAKMKLFEHPLSPYAQKVKISLYEKGVEFETTIPNIGGPDPAFEAVSPRREVPCLVDGPLEVFDSTIILEYLEDKFPNPAMLPSGAAERARVRMIEELATRTTRRSTGRCSSSRRFAARPAPRQRS